MKDARQAPPSSLSIPAQCSAKWAEPLRRSRWRQAPLAPPTTDHNNDDDGHVLPANELEEPPSRGRSPVQVTSTLQGSDTGGTAGFQLGGFSPPVNVWRGRDQHQGGLGVRLRQAGLTPPSLLKRSASLAKLDHLQLSTLDLSDLEPRSGGGTGVMEPR